MKNNLGICLIGLLFLIGCQNEERQKIHYDDFTFLCDHQIKERNKESTIEGSEFSFKMNGIQVQLSSGYYSNNLYEYDAEIVPSFDTIQIKQLKEENIPFVIADRKSDVDLDYVRIYNVFFDTVRDIPIKILKPRIPYTHNYKVFIAKVPGSYKKNIGYKSLVIEFEKVKSESDVAVFEAFYQSMSYSSK